MTMSDGSSIVTTYDAFNRPKTVTRRPAVSDTGALAQTTEYRYDANGNISHVIDPIGRVTTYTYDGYDRNISRTDPLGRISYISYDSRDRVVKQTLSASGVLVSEVRYEYDSVGRPTRQMNMRIEGGSVQSSGHREARISYDTAGRILTTQDALGRVTSRGYDSLGRLTLTTDPLGGQSRTTYDRRDLPVSTELLTSTGGVRAKTTMSYDSV